MKNFFILLVLLSLLTSRSFSQNRTKTYTKAPFLISKSPDKLAKYLTKHDSTDLQKAINIYTWITNNIKYDLKALKKQKATSHTVKKTLRRRKGICQDYSELFAYLCKKSGIKTQLVTGYSKGFGYHKEDTFFKSDHAWNAILIDSSWHLVDATWGSGAVATRKQWFKELKYFILKKPYIKNKYKFIQRSDMSYFMTDPEEFISNHLPINPEWQLLTYPVSVSTYESDQWEHYTPVIDSSYAVRIDSAYNNSKLIDYQRLQYLQYYRKTANKSFEFNKRNFAILANSSYYDALSISNLRDKKSKQEAIKRFNEASRNYNKQIRSSKSECSGIMRQIKTNIKVDLKTPLDQRIKKTNQILAKKQKLIDKHEYKTDKITVALEKLSIAKNKKLATSQNLSNVKLVWDTLCQSRIDSVKLYKDSISFEFIRLQSCIEKIDSLNQTLITAQQDESQAAYNLLFSIMNAFPYDSKVSAAKSLHAIGQKSDQTIKTTDSLYKQVATCKKNLNLFQRNIKILIATCSKSNTLKQQNKVFLNHELLTLYDYKIRLLELELDFNHSENKDNITLYNAALRNKKTLESSKQMVSIYESLRINQVESRNQTNELENKTMINNCNANISTLKSQ